MKVLLDSNIVLDMLLDRLPFVENAEKIFELAATEQISGYLSASNLTDIFYLAKKTLSDRSTKEAISDLMNLFKVLGVGEKECRSAIMSDNPDFEDALIEVCAVTADMDYIVTRDKKFLELSNRTISPEDLLARISDA